MQCKIWRGKGEGRKTTETQGVLWKMHKSGKLPSARIILDRLLSSKVFNFNNM